MLPNSATDSARSSIHLSDYGNDCTIDGWLPDAYAVSIHLPWTYGPRNGSDGNDMVCDTCACTALVYHFVIHCVSFALVSFAMCRPPTLAIACIPLRYAWKHGPSRWPLSTRKRMVSRNFMLKGELPPLPLVIMLLVNLALNYYDAFAKKHTAPKTKGKKAKKNQ